MTPSVRNSSAASPSSDSGLMSLAITIAPRETSRRAAATPLRAIPTTSTFLPLRSIRGLKSLPQLQRREAEQREQYCNYQEPKHQLRFHATRNLRRIHQLEVMMYRGHLEYAPMKNLERSDLQNHRHRFDHEHAADHHQQ